jgi:hypothetical protein
MTSADAHDAETGHVLLDMETFEFGMDELLTPGPLGLSPFLDVAGGDDGFGVPGDPPSPLAGSAADTSKELSGVGAVSEVRGDLNATGSGQNKANAAAPGKKRRVNANQAETQKRYRERKKSKLAELERTIAELREQVRSLRSKSKSSNSGSGSPPRSEPGSESRGMDPKKETSSGGESGDDVVALFAPHAHYEMSFKTEPAFAPGDEPRPASPRTSDRGSAEDASGSLMREVAALAISSHEKEKVAGKNGSEPVDALNACFAKALETGEVLRDGPETKARAPVSFRSFAEAELFYADQRSVYDLSVEKLKGLMQVGASDDVVRAAVLDIVGVVSDARRQRPDVAFFTTQQAQIQMLDDDCAPRDAPDGRGGFTQQCPTSCAYMVKSVVDRKLMKGDWPRIVRSVCEALPPVDIVAICDWGDEFLLARRDVLLARAATIVKHRPPGEFGSFEGEPTVFGMTAADLKADRDKKDGVYRTLFEGLREEMRLHHEGTVKLFSALPPRSAAAIIILTHPVALDTFSLATELKRVRGIEPRNLNWLQFAGIEKTPSA